MISKEEKKWRAQDDVRTLMEAEKIKADKKRMSAAKKEAMNIAKEKLQEVKAVQKLTSKSVKSNKTKRK